MGDIGDARPKNTANNASGKDSGKQKIPEIDVLWITAGWAAMATPSP